MNNPTQIFQNITPNALTNEVLENFEQFVESRETYIKGLEKTIEVLKLEINRRTESNIELKQSFEEIIALQRLSNVISTSVEPGKLIDTLIELTKQVIPVVDSNIFLFTRKTNKLEPFLKREMNGLEKQANLQLESGIVDWVLSEKKTVIIPDLNHLTNINTTRNFVIVPLIIRNEPIGIYVIHTEKPQQGFSHFDIQLLSVLTNFAAVGIENWRTYQELISANEEIKSSQERMIQVSKLAAVGELAASIMHEMRTPVQYLMFQLDLAKRGLLPENWIDLFSQKIEQLVLISKRLLDFCRDDSYGNDFEIVKINDVICNAVDTVRKDFTYLNIKIELNLAQNIPAIFGKSTYLQLVFMNLLINARDAMPQGGLICISSELVNNFVVIKFSDNGKGISVENLEKVFLPFFTTKTKDQGTGLGLSISRRIINQHKGNIQVYSEIDKGTTFIITLPTRKNNG